MIKNFHRIFTALCVICVFTASAAWAQIQLGVSIVAPVPPDSTLLAGASDVPLLHIRVTNNGSEEVTISSITISAPSTETGDDTTISFVNLYKDVDQAGVVDGSVIRLATDNYYVPTGGSIDFTNPVHPLDTIPGSTSRDYLVAYNFLSDSPPGTYTTGISTALQITGAGDSTGTPIQAIGSFPLNGATITIATPTPTYTPTITYTPTDTATPTSTATATSTATIPTLFVAISTPASADTSVVAGTWDVPVMHFQIGNPGVDSIDISYIVLTSSGHDQGVTVSLWQDDDHAGVVDGSVNWLTDSLFSASSHAATFIRAPLDTLDAGVTQDYLFSYDFAGNAATGAYGSQIASSIKIVGTDTTLGKSIVVSGPFPLTGANITVVLATPTFTYSPTLTASNTPTSSPTLTPTLTETNSPTDTATNTATSSFTDTATDTATNTATHTATSSATNTATATISDTPTNTTTLTLTNTPTDTLTNTPTNTFTNTATNSATDTATNTATNTGTDTAHGHRYCDNIQYANQHRNCDRNEYLYRYHHQYCD
jgi:hypothetical protein